MARIVSEIQFVGSIGELSAYRMHGQDKIIVRKKGGPSKSKIKRSPRYARTRQLNVEFGGRATASKWFMHMLMPMKSLADYNVAGPINALFKPIQALDTMKNFGHRNIELSKNPKLFEGFLFNTLTPFDTTLRATVNHSLSKENRSATIEIPELIPGVNFYPSQRHTTFSVVVTLGVMPDLYCDKVALMYISNKGYSIANYQYVSSDWFSVNKPLKAFTLTTKLETPLPDDNHCLVLSIGIRYGILGNTNNIIQAKRAGCAKVLGVV